MQNRINMKSPYLEATYTHQLDFARSLITMQRGARKL